MKKFYILFLMIVITCPYSFGQVGVNTTNPKGVFHVDAEGNNNTTGAPTPAEQKDDFTILSNGSIGVGTISPDPSAILELNVNELATGSKKGFLGPKVVLTNNTDITTIPNPAVGLLVYNLGTDPTFPVEGFLYWNGTEWVKFGTRTSVPGDINFLNCSTAKLQPLTYQAGMPYEGILVVSYTGGNGGSYSSGTPIPSTGVTGLTATLQPGDLEYGSGQLIYTVTGTPSSSSPDLATFSITLGSQTCAVSVGAREIPRGESEYFNGGTVPANATNGLYSDYDTMPNVEDILMFDVYIVTTSNLLNPISIIPRVYNISSSPVKIWWQGMTSVEGRGDGNVLLAPGGYQDLDNGMFLGVGSNHITGIDSPKPIVNYALNAEGYRFDFIFNDKWYRVEMSFLVDNMDTTDLTDNLRKWYCVITRMF